MTALAIAIGLLPFAFIPVAVVLARRGHVQAAAWAVGCAAALLVALIVGIEVAHVWRGDGW